MCPRNPESAAAGGAAALRLRRRAFSLIELIAAVAIVVILAGLAFALAPGVMGKAKQDRARSELQIIQQALEEYRGRFGDYPRVLAGASFLASNRRLLNALNGRINAQVASNVVIDVPPMLNNSVLTFAKANIPLTSPTEDNLILDPWSNPYRYHYRPLGGVGESSTSTPYGYLLYSVGPNGIDESVGPSGVLTSNSGDDIKAQ